MSQIPHWYNEVLAEAISVNELLHRSFSNKYFNRNFLKNLCGSCHVGSVFLLRRIKHFKPKLVVGSCYFDSYCKGSTTGHCWLEIDEYIIDCTYSQFVRYENIKICNKKSHAAKRYIPEKINLNARYVQWGLEGNQNPNRWRHCKKTNNIVPTKLFFDDKRKSTFTDFERKFYK